VIYRKVLKLSPNGRKVFTTGEIVNIMSVDTQRVMEYVQIANLLWICPLQISFSIYLLWQHLQYGSFAGLSIMLLLLPINGFIGAKMRRKQIRLLQQRDQRTKLMSEILNGIKVLKLYAWEPSFVEQIKKYRINEIKNLRKQAYLSSGITFAFNSAPFFVSLKHFSLFLQCL
jgi:ABC-type multidrug transport system fused ATPase/permease subunit